MKKNSKGPRDMADTVHHLSFQPAALSVDQLTSLTKNKMNKRKFISIAVALAYLVLLVTGILMYLKPFDKITASIHTFFGLGFLGMAAFHLKNNWTALKNYIQEKKKLKKVPITKTFIISAVTAVLLVAGLFADLPLLGSVYDWGNAFRNEQLGKTTNEFEYEIIQLEEAIGDVGLELEVKKGASFGYPLFAIWAEGMAGNYLQTLYVSKSIATSVFEYGKEVDGKWEPAVVRRPEALPRWSHQRGIKSADGYHLPEKGVAHQDLDGYTGATPQNNFILHSKFKSDTGKAVRIFFEVNQSFDWNEYYTKDRYPEDEIYSGSGKVGQPAVVYSAVIDLNEKATKRYFLEPVGHSHYSGKNGELFVDLSEITTALDIVERIIVSVKPAK